MNRYIKSRLVSAALTCAMLLTCPVTMVKAAAEIQGKYVSEVFIAYGSTADEARNWLTSHGWEPVEGNFNAGKKEGVAAVMGIKRTSDPNDAVTDVAVMNMGAEGSYGYSFTDYSRLVEEKKTEIDEFVDNFMPVIQEYRENYKGKGSAAGKARAEMAYMLLNKFYDGEIEGEYAMNDTGKNLGDLFLGKTRRELGEKEYDALSKNDRVQYGDLQQIILESSGYGMVAVEQALVMAADTDEDTWLERLSAMSDMTISEMAEAYAGGSPSLGDSAAGSLLRSKFGDAAAIMADGYDDIRQEMLYYISYNDTNKLWMNEGESVESYAARQKDYFDALKATDENKYQEEFSQYSAAALVYNLAYNVAYEGDWGETLGDFFLPEDNTDYGEDADAFLPFAAALSDGQRAGLQLVSLRSLLMMGAGTAEALNAAMPDVNDLLRDAESISIYSGMKRGIFRGGVALTNAAMMEQNHDSGDALGGLWDLDGIENIAAYAVADVGKQWLALYTVKSSTKGDPILADSLKLQTGSDAMPAGCTQGLPFFTYTYAMDIADMAYAYNNDMHGIYFFWDTDENPFTATNFTRGQLALTGIGGLAVGILGSSAVMLATKKRKETPDGPAVA